MRSRSCCRAVAATARAASRRSSATVGWFSPRARPARSSTACRSRPWRPASVDHVYPPSDLARVLCGLPPNEPSPDATMLSRRSGARLAAAHAPRSVRDRLLALQDDDDRPPHQASRRPRPHADAAGLRGPRRRRAQRAEPPLSRPAYRRDAVLPRPRGIRGAGAVRDPEPARSYPGRSGDPRVVSPAARPAKRPTRSRSCSSRRSPSASVRQISRSSRPMSTSRRSSSRALASTARSSSRTVSAATARQVLQPARRAAIRSSQELRQVIVFARHNLTKDAPFTKMHMISCRNLLIYFQPQAQRTVMSLFHFALATGGVLFLGASETPGALGDEFTTIDEHRQDLPQAARRRISCPRCDCRSAAAAARPLAVDLPARVRPGSADPRHLRSATRSVHAAVAPRRRESNARR